MTIVTSPPLRIFHILRGFGLKAPNKVGKMKGVDMPLSDKEMKRLFEKAGWVFLRQKGSHAWMEKGRTFAGIPMHKEIATGTEHALLKKLKEEA